MNSAAQVLKVVVTGKPDREIHEISVPESGRHNINESLRSSDSSVVRQ